MEFDKWKVNALKTELFADKKKTKRDSTVDPVSRIKSQLNQLGLG